MKIAVIGYSGAGKSTLAKRLADRCGLPLLYLDRVQFTAGWQERDREEARAMVSAFMEQDGWVIDGNYAGFLQTRRLAEADRIVFLDFPRRICIPRAFRRLIQFRRRTRESMADGCCETMDWTFFCWLLWKGRTAKHRGRYRDICLAYPEKTAILKSPAQVERFCAEIGA